MQARWIFLLLLGMAGPVAAEPRRATAPPAATRCNEPSECALYPADCCGECGRFSPENVAAYNGDWVEEHNVPGCAGVGCARCAERDVDYPQHQQQLVATCEKKRCVVKKLDQMPLTQCKRDDECVAATPACCACDWRNSVAVRADKKDALYRMTCTTSNMGVGCPACAKVGGQPHVKCKQGRCALDVREEETRATTRPPEPTK